MTHCDARRSSEDLSRPRLIASESSFVSVKSQRRYKLERSSLIIVSSSTLPPTPASPSRTDRHCYNSRTSNETCSPTGEDMKASLRRAVKGSSHASLRVKVTHLLPNMQICLSHYGPPYYTADPQRLFGLRSAPRKESLGVAQLSVNSRLSWITPPEVRLIHLST
ncbi:unnamed protein product [Nezara viridula]|uniref:Uncharacterized protein n=1 Tax=Nezara viridula TaxID=85310 RepID=A0A9P0H7L7_NEZVI|nr:unnamed protein product [Nezara viridula]